MSFHNPNFPLSCIPISIQCHPKDFKNTDIHSRTHRERNINYFTGPIERGTQRVAVPVERTVKRIDNRLPLEQMALNADKRIKSGIDRVAHWPRRS